MNRQELCYRYGWKFSSDMPDVYISRAGMQNKDLDEKFVSTELEEIQKKFQTQEQRNQIVLEEIRKEAQIEKEKNRMLMEKLMSSAKLRNDVLVELYDVKKQLKLEFMKEIEEEFKQMVESGRLVVKS